MDKQQQIQRLLQARQKLLEAKLKTLQAIKKLKDKEMDYEELKQRIEKTMRQYRKDNHKEEGPMSDKDWLAIYRQVGMDEKEIREYEIRQMEEDEKVKDRLTEALLTYRRENLLGAGQESEEDWKAIYRNAGISEEERLARLNRQTIERIAALTDPLDAYRS